MNVADYLELIAQKFPHKLAIVEVKKQITFSELNQLSWNLVSGLKQQKIEPSQVALVLLSPSIELVATVFALFRAGVVISIIDPAMSWKNIRNCLEQLNPSCVIGNSKTLWLSHFFSALKNSKKIKYAQLVGSSGKSNLAIHAQPCAILFTSGATGAPKGVEYTHSMFSFQVESLKKAFDLQRDDKDFSGFFLFSIFCLCMGVTTYIPSIDYRYPAKVSPQIIVQLLQKEKISFASGSPALWGQVGEYCKRHDIKLSNLSRLALFGAPVSIRLHELLSSILPKGEVFTPYGATESLPVAVAKSQEVLTIKEKTEAEGMGIFLGKVVNDVNIKIDIDSYIPKGEPSILSTKIGEILVSSPSTSHSYYNNLLANHHSKISEENLVWHRMGDMGYLDENNHLWFCGRKSHMIYTSEGVIYPITIEALFNSLEGVKKTALVGVGSQGKELPVLVVQVSWWSKLFPGKIKRLIQQKTASRALIQRILFRTSLPVDTRHNIKIDRLALKNWAERKCA